MKCGYGIKNLMADFVPVILLTGAQVALVACVFLFVPKNSQRMNSNDSSKKQRELQTKEDLQMQRYLQGFIGNVRW